MKCEFWDNRQDGQSGPHYLVHYHGWKDKYPARCTSIPPFIRNRWDEWVPESRVLKFNEENLAKQRELREFYARKRSLEELGFPKREGMLRNFNFHTQFLQRTHREEKEVSFGFR